MTTSPEPSGCGARCAGFPLFSIDVGLDRTGDQASSPTERQILESPLNEHQDPVLEFHNVHQMDEQPDQPRRKAGDMKPKNVRDGRRAADNGHVAFVEIFEWWRRRLA